MTFRLYTTLNIVNIGKIQFPEFEGGFMVEDIALPVNQQLQMERYNGRNYYTADLRKTLLFPQRSGQITIPRGNLEMVFFPFRLAGESPPFRFSGGDGRCKEEFGDQSFGNKCEASSWQ